MCVITVYTHTYKNVPRSNLVNVTDNYYKDGKRERIYVKHSSTFIECFENGVSICFLGASFYILFFSVFFSVFNFDSI